MKFVSVKLKTLLISTISFFIITIVTFAVFGVIIFRYIDKIEYESINDDFKIVQALIEREEENMHKTTLDWAHWDDTYNFLSGKNKDFFIETNLQDTTLKQLNLNFMFFTDTQGKIVYSMTKDLDKETRDLLVNKLLNKSSDSSSLIKLSNTSAVRSGILSVYGKMFIIDIANITTTDEKAKSNGNFIVGRYLDTSFTNYINEVVKAKVDFKEIIHSNEADINIIKKRGDSVILNNPIRDIIGDMSIVSSISKNRYNYQLGKIYFKSMILIFSIILILILFINVIIFNKYILSRLKTLNEFINNVAITRNTKARINISGKDEIKNIADSTNRMLGELESAYKDIFNLSYSDKLTSLRNRAYVENKLERLDKQVEFNYSIIMGDVNGLKLVNDTFGHKEGDRLICKIGNILQNVCSKDDIIARWGGDEFIILIVGKENSYSSKLIQNIKKECEGVADFGFKVSIALGSAEKKEGINLEEVMNLAEERMYRSKLTEAKSSRNGTVMSLERTLYEKHSDTEEHTQRIKELSVKLGKKINLPEDKLSELELLGSLHDIGKIGIPDYILMKPGKLTNEEWEIMKRHTEIGYRIAKATPELSHVADEILSHHERFDGTGYPQGIKGHEIPILSRIINVVDSFDVMTHKRVYKDAADMDYAIKELKRCSGTQFDPVIADEFIDLLDENNSR
jgi:diguanylate cyclase (GGDEF)-like protein